MARGCCWVKFGSEVDQIEESGVERVAPIFEGWQEGTQREEETIWSLIWRRG